MKNLRSASLETMRAELSDHLKCEMHKQDIMKKIHTLKSQFQREVSAVKASQKSGAGADDVYTPKLWCYEELSFLADGDVIRESTSNLEKNSSTQQVSPYKIYSSRVNKFDLHRPQSSRRISYVSDVVRVILIVQ